MSQLTDLLNVLPNGTPLPLDENADPAISLPTHNPAFVRPPLDNEKNVRGNNTPIILISAPGAVGKSELARFVAAEKECHLWDLSKLTIGTNTFRGTLAKSFDPENYSGLVAAFKRGEVLFVLDAFDEAEIKSGWLRIEKFLDEIVSFVKNATNPCLVLLARSETTQYIDMYLENVLDSDDGMQQNTAIHTTYSIEYFPEKQAREFLEKQLEAMGRDAQQQHATPFKEAVNQIFNQFYKAVRVEKKSDETPWLNARVRSFLGYAPVLQAIAQYLAQSDNYLNVSNEFISESGFEDGTNLICDLMKKLLLREQEKVLKQLKQNDMREAIGWDGWENLYTPDEQLERIFLRLNASNKDRAYDVHANGIVPHWLIESYSDAIRRFLDQHPFTVEMRFAGPAFQDYTFAYLLKKGHLYSDVKKVWHEITTSTSTYVPSPLFALLYKYINQGRASADLVGYLCESAISRLQFSSQAKVIVIPKDDSSENAHQLQIVNENFSVEDIAQEGIDFSFEFPLDETDVVEFPRRLHSAYIEIKGTVSIGSIGSDFELSDTQLKCNKLEVNSSNIVIRNYRIDDFVTIEANHYVEHTQHLRVETNDESKVNISWPNGRQYPWVDYYYEPTQHEEQDMREAILALRRILAFFRKDKRDEFARYKQLIDNVVVGNNPTRQNMRDYLISKGILTHTEPLYYLHTRDLEEISINFESLLRQGELHPDAQNFISSFIEEYN